MTIHPNFFIFFHLVTVTVMMISKYYYITLNKDAFFLSLGDTKGTFHVKIGTMKDRNSKDLTEAEDIKMRWQEYRELCKKKVLIMQIT